MKLAVNQEISVTICARRFWNSTELEVTAGESYSFTAIGTWRDLFEDCDANGYTNRYIGLFQKMMRAKSCNCFALVGSIDKRSNFQIGVNKNMSFQTNGTLYCYANDVPGFYWNNSGYVSLVIKRTM